MLTRKGLLEPPDWLKIYFDERTFAADHVIKWNMFRLDQLLAYDFMLHIMFEEKLKNLSQKYANYKLRLISSYNYLTK